MPEGWDYVAIAPIDHGGVRAFNVGDPVPNDNVKEHGYLDDKLVAKAGTKTADKALDEAAPPA